MDDEFARHGVIGNPACTYSEFVTHQIGEDLPYRAEGDSAAAAADKCPIQIHVVTGVFEQVTMRVTVRFIIVPLAFASLLSGLIQSLSTPWGLFRHYWILVKLLLTIFVTAVLLVKMELIGYAARLATWGAAISARRGFNSWSTPRAV